MSNGLATRETNTELLGPDGEVADFLKPSALESVTRAEVDIQIATAKRFPRSIDRFLKEAMSMVSVDPGLAAKCTYVLPGRTKKIKDESGRDVVVPIAGPSVRLAEIAVCCWGNLRIAGRIIDDDGKAVVAQGVCHDLEKNIFRSTEVRRGVLSNGKRYKEDMVNVTCNAAIAIATRNATFQVIPLAFIHMVEERAKEIARGDIATLGERADKALKHFVKLGVTEQEVFKSLGVIGFADINLDHLMILNGFKTSIIEGHATLGEIFRPDAPTSTTVAPQAPGESTTSALKRKLKADAPKNDPSPAAPGPSAAKPEPAPEPKPAGKADYVWNGHPAVGEDLVAAAGDEGWKGAGGVHDVADAIAFLRDMGHRISQAAT